VVCLVQQLAAHIQLVACQEAAGCLQWVAWEWLRVEVDEAAAAAAAAMLHEGTPQEGQQLA
jgi:hypothetical protein